MNERSSTRKGNEAPRRGKGDLNVQAWAIVQMATDQMPKPEPPREKNPAAVTLSRLGGLKGGKARAAKLSLDKRKAIAKKAAAARWSNATQS